jgi:two-component system OmpR family sensor kinase
MTRRIALAIVLTCWLALAGGGAVAYVAIRQSMLDELDAALVLRATSLPEVLGVRRVEADATGGAALPYGDRYLIRVGRGQTVARPDTRPAGAVPPALPEVRSRGFATLADGTRVRTVTLVFPPSRAGDEMMVVYSGSADRYHRIVRRMWLVFASVGLAAGLLTAGVAAGVARSALRPVRALAGTIASIDEATVHRRLDPGVLPTELRPMAERLNQMLERLEVGIRQRKRFMADAAHELRTPVAAVLTSMEVALRRPRDAAALTRLMQASLTDLRALRRLVEAMLEQFRADAAGGAGEPAEVDLSALLDLCADNAAAAARAKGVDVRRDYRGDLRAVTDARRVRSIVANLVSNAVEYSPAGASVELGCDVAPDGGLTIAVRDNGPGIPDDAMPTLFQPFARGTHGGDGAGNGNGGGLGGGDEHRGLGLYLVKCHAEALGGSCGVSPVPGGGTEFRVRLPASAAPTDAKHRIPAETAIA